MSKHSHEIWHAYVFRGEESIYTDCFMLETQKMDLFNNLGIES